jgi:hypothetical protein
MTSQKKSLSRRLTAVALFATLLAGGGIATTQQNDQAPSSGDKVPRCC